MLLLLEKRKKRLQQKKKANDHAREVVGDRNWDRDLMSNSYNIGCSIIRNEPRVHLISLLVRNLLCYHPLAETFEDLLFRALAVERQKTIIAVLRALSVLEKCLDVDGLFLSLEDISSRRALECQEFALTANEGEESVFR